LAITLKEEAVPLFHLDGTAKGVIVTKVANNNFKLYKNEKYN
jgi:hypothetical protein